MQQKIKNINIKGFRGVKDEITLLLAEKSALFYGDNGTGKSTIADAVEWFYKDSVKHLSSEEIDKTALRNSGLPETESSAVSINFSQANLESTKSLSINRAGRPTSTFSNTSDVFNEYSQNSEKENLLLRYRNLEDFIRAPKGDKLKLLSEIIGYGEVTKVKEVIQKSFSAIKNEIGIQGFENQIQSQQRLLIEKLGTNITTEEQLFKELNTLISPLNTGVTVDSLESIKIVIEKIKSPIDPKILEELKFLQNICDVLVVLQKEVEAINKEYQAYFDEFKKIFDDVESIKQTLLKEVLLEGKDVISNKIYTQNNCPLCLKEEKKESLLSNIEKRLKEIEESSEKLKELEKARNLIKLTVEERVRRANALLTNPFINENRYSATKSIINGLKGKLSNYLPEIGLKVLAGKMPKSILVLDLTEKDFISNPTIETQLAELIKKVPKDAGSDIRVKVEFAQSAFIKIKELNFTKGVLEIQKDSLGLIFNEFVKKQKEGLQTFLSSFSVAINEYYQFMNTDEPFENLEIVPMEEDEELKGITIQFTFNGKVVSPPIKYFSESHINCYGLSFFLASIKAFNKLNKFIVFDDVISSFDSNHRKRFADLLFEKFSDYQIILLTHETEWFMYVKELAKKKGWLIQQINWNKDKGTHLEETPSDLRELIEYQIKNNIESQLGNSIRKFLEHLLKHICFNLEVKTNFRFNEINEKRMPDELINELKSIINKKKL